MIFRVRDCSGKPAVCGWRVVGLGAESPTPAQRRDTPQRGKQNFEPNTPMIHFLQNPFYQKLCFSLIFLLGSFIPTASFSQDKVVAYQSNVIRVKFQENLTSSLSRMQTSRSSEGYVMTGISAIDQLQLQFGAQTMKRVFPYAGKYEAKHMKHGLHLWYEITFDGAKSADVRQALSAYASNRQIQIAEYVYKKELNIATVQASPVLPDAAQQSTNDPGLVNQWHYENNGQHGGTIGSDISLFQAWDIEAGSPDVIISIHDGGIDVDHPDLAANLWINEGEISGNGIDDDNNGYIDDVYGYDFVDGNGSIEGNDHGTHVAGIVAAVNNNGIGVAGVAGGTGNGDGARMMSCQVFSDIGAGSFAASYTYAADNGAVISQNSWGYTAPDVFEQAVLDGIDYFIAEAGYDADGNPVGPMQGGLVIFAAGNSNTDEDWYPGFYEPILSVAATNNNDVKSWYSNFGDWVDISAPGGETFLTEDPKGVYSTIVGGYSYYQGTSMACPHASGVGALIISHFPGISPEEVFDRLVTTANDINNKNPELEGQLGSGRLNAFNALQEDDGIAPESIADLSATEASQTTITLSWTAPSDEGNGSAHSYDLRYATFPVTPANFDEATEAGGIPVADPAGEIQSFTVEGLMPSTTYYFAIKSSDFFNNESDISNVVEATTDKAPILEVSPGSLTANIDVSENPVGTAKFTVTNSGEGELEYSATVSAAAMRSLLFPVDGSSEIDMTRYGKRSTTNGGYATANIGTKASAAKNTSPSANDLFADSLYYDSGDDVADDFVGTNGGPISVATKFVVEAANFTLTHVRNLYRTNNLSDIKILLEIYKGDSLPNSGEPLLAQIITEGSSAEEGNFFTIPLELSQSFNAGDVFWVIFHFPEGIDFPQGVDIGINTPGVFYASTTGGASWDDIQDILPEYAWKMRAMSGTGTDWISLEPESGIIEPGESQEVTVSFDGTNLANGSYDVNINLNTNDPLKSNFTIPAEVTVTGQIPEVIVSTDLVEFGAVFIGTTRELTLEIINEGLGDLMITNILSSEYFSIDEKTASISPGDTGRFMLTFTPAQTGNMNATLEVNTNDPGNSTIIVNLVGVGSEPPIIDVKPGSVSTVLNAGETSIEKLTIANNGLYPLQYSFPELAVQSLLANPEITRNNTKPIEFADLTSKEQMDDRKGHPVLMGAGGDLYNGYTWMDSDEEGGPIYNFVDISGTGTEILSNSIDDVSLVDLPFNFNFYGENYGNVYIAANGFLSFQEVTVLLGGFNNQQIPNTTDPNAVIAPFWDDLRPPAAMGNIYYQAQGDNFIVQYYQVGNYVGAGTATFQVVLHMNGDIFVYYQDVASMASLESATVGIENSDGTDGAQVVFNNIYIKDSLAIAFMPPPSAKTSFIADVSPMSGTIPPGQKHEIEVSVDATGLNDGEYIDQLTVSSNDPVNSPLTVIFELTVIGLPEILMQPDTLNFDSLFVGLSKTMSFNIKNRGTKALEIESISNGNEDFTVEAEGPLTIGPGDSVSVPVTFTPSRFGEITDEVEITSNDAFGNEIAIVALKGIGTDPPVIVVAPDSLAYTVDAGGQVYDTLTISNEGGSELQYSLFLPYFIGEGGEAPEQNKTSYIAFPELISKDQKDGRKGHPVLFGSGGPDGYGYTWVDNESGGPAYDWIEIEGLGEAIDVGNDESAEVAIGFEFPFYGKNMNNVFVHANGFLSFTQSLVFDFVNQQIPDTLEPNHLIAPLWADLQPADSGMVYYYFTGEEFVVQYDNVPGWGIPPLLPAPAPVTFQVILKPDGNIIFQYKDVESSTIAQSATVGVENELGTQGLQVVFNSQYVKDGMAITITPPIIGTVASGEIKKVPIVIDASELNDGLYEGSVFVNSNDPVTSRVILPVSLTVIGEPALAVADSLAFGTLFVSEDSVFSETKTLIIKNQGTKLLTISSLFVEGEAFVLEDNTGFALAPKDSAMLAITFIPLEAGDYQADLFIVSDDDDVGEDTTLVALHGSAIEPPVFTSSPDTIFARVRNDGAATEEISIKNEGESTLEYEAMVQYGADEFSVSDAMPVYQTYSAANIKKTASEVAAPYTEVVYDNGEIIFSDSIAYDPAGPPESFYGFDIGAPMGFTTANRFVVTSSTFSLTHIRAHYRTEAVNEATVVVEVYAAGSTPSDATLLTSQEFSSSLANGAGGYGLIALEEMQHFTSEDTFFIVMNYPASIAFPASFNIGVGGVDGISSYFDGQSWWSIGPEEVFKIRALQSEENTTPKGWITLSGETGELSPGASASITVDMHAAELEGGNYFAGIFIQNNDPFDAETIIPVKFSVNNLPEFILPTADTVEIDETETLNLVFKAIDPDGEVVLYSLIEEVDNASITVSPDSVILNLTPDYDQSGYHTFTVEAIDNDKDRSSKAVVIKVHDVNRAPFIVKEIRNRNYLINDRIDAIDLSLHIEDPDGDALAYVASATDTSIVGLSVEGNILFVSPQKQGRTIVSIVAEDGKGGITGTSFNLQVKRDNRSPKVANMIGRHSTESLQSGILIDLNTVFSDPDADELIFEAASDNEAALLATIEDGGNLRVQQIAEEGAIVVIVASDGFGGEVSHTYDLISAKVMAIGETGHSNAAIRNFPNPFKGETIISYTLEKAAKVRLELRDSHGKLINVLVDGEQAPGIQKISLSAYNLPPGIYIFILRTQDGKSEMGRMVIH